MEVAVGIFGHVVVEHDVHALNVNTATKEVGSNKKTLLEILEFSKVSNATMRGRNMSLCGRYS